MDMVRTRDRLTADKPENLYRLFGVTMASDYPFATPLPRVTGTPDLSFTCSRSPLFPADGMNEPVFASENKTDGGESVVSIWRTTTGHLVHYPKFADITLSSDAIIAYIRDPAYWYMIEILLLGEIFSLWLELMDIRTLHASAAVVDQTAIAFLATSKGGKSGLAAAFTQHGHQILADDIVAVEDQHNRFLARPGFPAMRMWPDMAGHFVGTYEDLALVHPEYIKRVVPVGHQGFGSFCTEKQPLRVIYMPHRLGPDQAITIGPVSKKDAFFALVQNSFTAGVVEALGLQPRRMDFFSRMVKQVPVRHLYYPEGFQHLNAVADAVLADMESLLG
jgi:hypothetical protein